MPDPFTLPWLPLVAQARLVGDGPWALQAAGVPLVLWRDAQGALHALHDQCPHRGAALSLGCVREGALQCAYHGWRFGSEGRCLNIPALPGFEPTPRHAARAWALRLHHGLCWVAPAGTRWEEPLAPPAGNDWPARRLLCGPFDVATSAPRVVENFLDVAHFAFVHPGTLGAGSLPEAAAYAVVHDTHGRPGAPAITAFQPRASAAASASAGAGHAVSYRYQLLSPYSAVLHKTIEGGLPAETYALWVLPLDDEASRVWFTIATEDEATSDDALLSFQSAVFAQDRAVLESQRPRRLPLREDAEAHCAADRLCVAYRRWLRESGTALGTC